MLSLAEGSVMLAEGGRSVLVRAVMRVAQFDQGWSLSLAEGSLMWAEGGRSVLVRAVMRVA